MTTDEAHKLAELVALSQPVIVDTKEDAEQVVEVYNEHYADKRFQAVQKIESIHIIHTKSGRYQLFVA